MAYSITLAGQDITNYTQQLTVKVDDTLGQGGGAGNGTAPQGRATTCYMETTLGPMNTAIGAGQPIPSGGQPGHHGAGISMAADTFNRSPASSWGTASDGTDVWSVILGTAADVTIATVGAFNAGQVSGSVGQHLMQLGTNAYDDTDITITGSVSTSGDTIGILARIQDSQDYYRCTYKGDGTLSLFVVISGTSYVLAQTSLTPFTLGVQIVMEFNITGTVLSGSVWLQTGSPPSNWQVTQTDSNYTIGNFGVYAKPGTTVATVDFINFALLQYPYVNPTGGINPAPTLVRQGEIIITDTNNNRVFGGFVTKYTDISSTLGPTRQATALDAIDYSTSLQRTIVDEIFSAQTDVQIIQFVMAKYAPWINLQYLPAFGNYTFTVKNFRQVTVEQVLQTVAGVTGYLVWVDYYKNLHYVSPSQASAAPFNLSDSPDFLSTFPHAVEEFIIDDNSAINRVTFYGGNKQSGDIVQDVSPLANGTNTIFVFAAYPLPDSSGAVRASVNGVFQVIGIANGNHGLADVLKSQGGLADCLIDTNGPNLTFDVAPASGASVKLYYRYNFPLAVQIADETSHRFFGNPYLDGVMTDNTIFDTQTAVQRCKVLLLQQSFGLVTLKVIAYKPGVQSGMTIHVTNVNRGINNTYLVQQVTTTALGGGTFQYEITCGAWNWNIVDIVVKMASLLNPPNLQNQGALTSVILQVVNSNTAIHDSWSRTEHQHGVYYARASFVGDGHDAFPGFSTISS